MKLLYCTTIKFPSKIANRYQIVAMSKAFNVLLGKQFYLGGRRIVLNHPNDINNIVIIGGRKKSYLLALRYLFFIRKHTITHIYCRDNALLFFIMIGNALFFRMKFLSILEMHQIPKPFQFFHKYIIKHAHTIITMTTYIKKELTVAGFNENKIFVASDGVDRKQFEKLRKPKELLRKDMHLPLNKKIITYYGSYKTMGMGKGVEDLIQAFSTIVKEYTDTLLLIVGIRDKDIDEVAHLCKESKLQDGTYAVIPYVPQADGHRYMMASDVLVMNFPHTNHFAYYMSPLKMFEYMAAGVPIVATDLPSVREVLNDSNAAIVPPDDLTALTNGLIRTMRDYKIAKKKAAQAQEDVKEYSWQKRAEAIIGYIKR